MDLNELDSAQIFGLFGAQRSELRSTLSMDGATTSDACSAHSSTGRRRSVRAEQVMCANERRAAHALVLPVRLCVRPRVCCSCVARRASASADVHHKSACAFVCAFVATAESSVCGEGSRLK